MQQEKTSKVNGTQKQQLTPLPPQQTQGETPKFQWSFFVDSGKREQFVIRTNDFADIIGNRAMILDFVAQEIDTRPVQQPEPDGDPAYCSLHDEPMKERVGKKGNKWHDHRWQDSDDLWHVCNGKTETIQQPR